ncbi:AAA family ATPase [Salibacterium aidingense]|uniref:AAA family ATPase n=1 Tax=Salibacterium aidingense TaxID=384933 RepID=UPI00041DC58C|nr:AAA family ATPase [Salibacterium aidingense]
MSVQKIKQIKHEISQEHMERDDILEALFTSLISGQHCLLIGPPGTGKSALIAEVVSRIEGMEYFQWLLTRFSTPEELFGPVSLKELEQGVYKRNTENKLPTAHVAFLDEIFKANSAILNALLTLINERVFYNNGGMEQANLMTMIGASNEYPEEEGLEALFDRFLLRFEIPYIQEDASFISMLKQEHNSSSRTTITLPELQIMGMQCDTIHIPDQVYSKMNDIRVELQQEGFYPSDRRFKQSLMVLKAKAMLDERDAVKEEDLLILKNALWEDIEERNQVWQIVEEHARDDVKDEVEQYRKEAMEVWEYLKQEQTTDAATEGFNKFKSIVINLVDLRNDNPDRKDEILELEEKVMAYRHEISKTFLDTPV